METGGKMREEGTGNCERHCQRKKKQNRERNRK